MMSPWPYLLGLSTLFQTEEAGLSRGLRALIALTFAGQASAATCAAWQPAWS